MEEKYNFFDKIKYISIQHRKITVLIMSFFILSILGIGASYGYKESTKGKKQDFDEIQVLINKIENHDANIINNYEVREIKKEVRGIDVSVWQGNIDWEKVKNSNKVDFAIIRVGSRKLNSGEIVEDTYFKKNIKGAIAQNIPVGVYFYSAAKTELEVLEEASFVLNKIKRYKITYPVVYDLENFGQNRLANVSDERINYNALIFLNYFRAHGYDAMLYGNKTALTNHWNLNRFEGFKIWLAHYVEQTTYLGNYDLWQYSEEGQIDGIPTLVDLNVGTLAYEEVEDN